MVSREDGRYIGSAEGADEVTYEQRSAPTTEAQPAMTELWSAEEVSAGIARLADQLAAAYSAEDTVNVLPVMTGALYFAASLTMELERRAPGRWLIAPVYASAYGDEHATASAEVLLPPGFDERVGPESPTLIVDDVLDTGVTMQRLLEVLEERGLSPVSVAVLVNKPHHRTIGRDPDFTAFTTDTEHWLVGYGMDHERRFRGLDSVRYLDA